MVFDGLFPSLHKLAQHIQFDFRNLFRVLATKDNQMFSLQLLLKFFWSVSVGGYYIREFDNEWKGSVDFGSAFVALAATLDGLLILQFFPFTVRPPPVNVSSGG